MKDISIYIDSCADLTKEEIKKLSVKVIPLYYYFDNEDIEYGDKINLKMSDFFFKKKNRRVENSKSYNVI